MSFELLEGHDRCHLAPFDVAFPGDLLAEIEERGERVGGYVGHLVRICGLQASLL